MKLAIDLARPFVGALLLLVLNMCIACAGVGEYTPTVIRGTLGGLYAACQTVESDDATWRRICDGVEQAMPALNQLGAGPAELPPAVAAREVTITIGDAQ